MTFAIDHIVLTVRDPAGTAAFFQRALAIDSFTFAGGRMALRVGDQKINLQTLGQEIRNHAAIGSGDLCLLTETPLANIEARLAAETIPIVEGPVEKSGAQGAIRSLYITDPDGNLIEICNLV